MKAMFSLLQENEGHVLSHVTATVPYIRTQEITSRPIN